MPRTNYGYLVWNLVIRDFKIRYRNMSLGVFWSLLNPLVLMGVLTFVFTRIFPPPSTENFHIAVLCGLVVFSFFALGWQAGTISLYANAGLLKKVPVPRELVPISTVLANALHFLIQIGLLVVLALAAGYRITAHWLWLPYVFAMEIVFVCGLSLASSALDVYFRDVRYVVESTNTVMFWLVPIFYSFAMIPERYRALYQYNPVAAVVLATRTVILQCSSPPMSLLWKLTAVSLGTLALGWWLFGRLKPRFAEFL